MRFKSLLVFGFVLLLAASAGVGLFLTQEHWRPWFEKEPAKDDHAHHHDEEIEQVELSPQAYASIRPEVAAVKPRSAERYMKLPGSVADRPGRSDRAVPAPVAGVVVALHVERGELVAPGKSLLTLHIVSEGLQTARVELMKTMAEMTRNRKRYDQIKETSTSMRLQELNQDHDRLVEIANAYILDLKSRGLNDDQIKLIQAGKLVETLEVFVPVPLADQKPLSGSNRNAPFYEVKELKVDIGQRIEAGHPVVQLANHHQLLIEGRAFAPEAAAVDRALKDEIPVEVEFIGDEPKRWGSVNQTFTIRSADNSFDPTRRTMSFQMPLQNQAQAKNSSTPARVQWRFRPNQKVIIGIPVEQWDNVFVLPREAVVREGPEAFIFSENGKTGFERKPVRLLDLDERRAVIARDGSLRDGERIAHHGAAALQRVLQVQSSGGADHGHDHPH